MLEERRTPRSPGALRRAQQARIFAAQNEETCKKTRMQTTIFHLEAQTPRSPAHVIRTRGPILFPRLEHESKYSYLHKKERTTALTRLTHALARSLARLSPPCEGFPPGKIRETNGKMLVCEYRSDPATDGNVDARVT